MSLPQVLVAARAASSKTFEETLVLDVAELIAITDHFVITAGANDRQVRAIVDEVTRALREADGLHARSTEGLQDGHWVLLDYGDFIVHVFDATTRGYFGLERLWSDAPRIDFAEPPKLAHSATRVAKP